MVSDVLKELLENRKMATMFGRHSRIVFPFCQDNDLTWSRYEV